MTVSARVEKCMEMALMPGQAGILKPVIQNRFEGVRPLNDFMFVKSEHNVIRISFSDIYFIEGYKDYVKIYTGGPRPIMTILTFRSLEEILPKNLFVRIHKSFIISIEKIKSFRRGKVLVMDRHIPIGASYADIFNQQVVAGRLIDY
ncbi:MAG: LytTR family DNA-binding domain-containing protein [Bacteroidota bacterium]